MNKYIEPGSRIMDRAWLRDGELLVNGEALLLAMLLHAKGKNRRSSDMTDVRRIFGDQNLDKD